MLKRNRKNSKSRNTRYLDRGKFEVKINVLLLQMNRIYLPVSFARDLQRIGGSPIWRVTGPANTQKNEFEFIVYPSGGRKREHKFGNAWEEFCDVYRLKKDQICTFEIVSDHLMVVSI
ncbi:hypothetical protein PIB30_059519 [Stylosanthes scabra]|uniref:TF-B3 domain-containing protein n=1 Tax=Stylosanthes scabra TaxID=79078 RepID=A0ABU6QKW7_9FABA|nr:hypothetical protein [Stylosanthes scabra]